MFEYFVCRESLVETFARLQPLPLVSVKVSEIFWLPYSVIKFRGFKHSARGPHVALEDIMCSLQQLT